MAILRSRHLGQTQIKGVEEPLNIYEVLGAGPFARGCKWRPGADSRGLSDGRVKWSSCSRALEQAKAGHGQIVGVMGEPGLGKSRLFYEFKLLSLSWLSGAGSLLGLARQSVAVSAGD